MYEAVIFDNDGVLLSLTELEPHREGARDALAAVGVEDPSPEDVETISLGVSPADLQAICDRHDIDPSELWRARDREVSARQRAEMRAGRKAPYDDIDTLAAFECPLGVVSSNQTATVEFAFEHFGLDEYFQTVYARPPTLESLRLKKPNPHYVEQALADLDTDRALFVGDNESDVEAAHAAGIDAAFIRRPHRVDHDLSVDPEYEVDDLEGVLTIVDGADPASD